MRLLAALLVLSAATAVAASAAQAQNSPVGLWRTIDDHTGQEKSLVRIVEVDGLVSGKVERLLRPGHQNDVCAKCRDERHGKSITGMSIIAGLRQHGDVWDGGQILDPESGKIYSVRLRPVEDGKELEVRGYIGPFFRTQTWVRSE